MNQQLALFDDLSAYEGTDVEYKSAKGGLPVSLWETYSAFANTDGGVIYLGIAERGGKIDVHGLVDAEKQVSDFWNTVNNRSKVNRNLLANGDVALLALPGSQCKVVAIRVPRADRSQRPVHIGSNPFTATFRRNFEGDYRCTEAEVRRMLADQPDGPGDSRILEGFGLDDLDPVSLRQYRQRFSARVPNHAWLNEDDAGLLEKLGGWRRERVGAGYEGITLAGLLMFGKAEAIQCVEAVPGFHLDYRERLADDPATRWSDRVTIDGTWEANLFQFYQKMMAKFGNDTALKQPFYRNARGVRGAGSAVHEALEEALVNALIHSDYAGQGGIVIDRYPNRFEFSNPGMLLMSLEQILRGGVSECRNKCLQKMFQMLGAGDKAGSGVNNIRRSWEDQHWRSPRLDETQQPDRVKWTLPLVSMLPPPVLEELDRRFGEAFHRLDKDSVHTLVIACSEEGVTNQRLQETLSLHRHDITALLQDLVHRDFLTSDGVGRGTHYAIRGGAFDFAHASTSQDRLEAGIEPPELGPEPPELGSEPPELGPEPPELGPEPPDQPTSGQEAELAPALWAMAAPVRASRRSHPDMVTKAILDMCQGQFLSLHELSRLLGRQPETLRGNYVAPLVREGRLQLRYPDKPSHRKQAYRSLAEVSGA